VTVLLGLDVGERRIGLAVGDDGVGVARPLLTFGRSTPERDAAIIRRVAAEQGAEALVVGLPLDARGGIGPQAARTQAWAAAVAPLVGSPVHWRDERYTSEAAETSVGPARRGRSGGAPSSAARRAWRGRIDREAAAAILQAELDARLGVAR
jgi:putative Holliday junction resolvase